MRVCSSLLAIAIGLFGCGAERVEPTPEAMLDVPLPDDPAGAPGKARYSLTAQCFFGMGSSGQLIPLSKIIHELRVSDFGTALEVAVIFNREFVDNTYGANAIGWSGKRGHTFRDLYKSDHVELGLRDRAGEESFRAKLDYLSESPAVASGFSTLGVGGGDGSMIRGSASDLLSTGTSIDDNFNTAGYVLLLDSPATDAMYTPNAEFPNWNFWVEYRLRILPAAFGASGFDKAAMELVHASPAKLGGGTITVVEDDCPEEGEVDPFPPCERTDPANECGDAGEGETPPAPPCSSSEDCVTGSCSDQGYCISI